MSKLWLKLDLQRFAASASISCTEKSQDIAKNETIVRITFTVKRTSGTTYWSDSKKLTWKITYLTDSGTETFTQDTYFSFPSGSVGASKSNYIELSIPHKSDGTQKITYSASIATGTSVGTLSPSGSATLTTIPRGSVLGSIGSFTIGNAINIPITKYSSSFTDTLTISVGGTTIKTINNITNGYDVNFTETELNNIYKKIPNATSGTFTFKLTTKSGSTTIGTSSKSVTGKINTNVVRPSFPTFTATEASGVVPSDWGIFVRNKTKLKFVISASAGTGATISSITTKIDGSTYSGTEFTTEAIKTAGSLTVDISVTDSRGVTSSSARAITIVDYDNPYITSASAIRSDLGGAQNDSGTYLRIDLKAGVYSIEGNNTASYKVQYKKTTGNNWQEYVFSSTDITYDGYIRIPNIDTNSSYDVQVVITDYFTSVIKILPTIPTAFVTVDYKSGGHGIAFGKVAEEEDLMDIAFATKFTGGIAPIVADTAGADLNDFTKGGFYFFPSEYAPTNIPIGVNGWLEVIAGPEPWVKQIWYRAGTKNTNDFHTYVRTYSPNNGWSDWRRLALDSVELYNNSSGTTGTVTLNESVTNYSYIEIFYGKQNTNLRSVKVYSPNNKVVSLDNTYSANDTTIQVNSSLYRISDTSITKIRQYYVNINASGVNKYTSEDTCSISRVIAYK